MRADTFPSEMASAACRTIGFRGVFGVGRVRRDGVASVGACLCAGGPVSSWPWSGGGLDAETTR